MWNSMVHYGCDHCLVAMGLAVERRVWVTYKDGAEEISKKWSQQDFFILGSEGKERSLVWPLSYLVPGLRNKVGCITETGKAWGLGRKCSGTMSSVWDMLLTTVLRAIKRLQLLIQHLDSRGERCCCLCCHSVAKSYLTLLWPCGLYPTKFLCPWDFPGKNTGMSSHFLHQGIFLTQGSNLHLLQCRQILYHCATREAPRSDCCWANS